jgi:hypothetical protein
LDSIQAERNELQAKLTVAERRLAEVAEFEAASRDRLSEISNLTGQVEAREREVSSLHFLIQILQAAMGEKQVLEAQLEQVRSQLILNLVFIPPNKSQKIQPMIVSYISNFLFHFTQNITTLY